VAERQRDHRADVGVAGQRSGAVLGWARVAFASRRLTQGGTTDLFQATRADASSPFASSLAPISELNTSASEEDPWISQDGRHILFTSDRSGRSRIYEAWR